MKTLDILSTIGALVLAATPLAVVSVAHAETSVAIPVADLDFSSRADVARFNARVAVAADHICSDRVDTRDLSQAQACQSAVRDEAMAKLGTEQRQAMASGQASGWRLAAR